MVAYSAYCRCAEIFVKVVHAVVLEERISVLCREVIHSLADLNFCSQMKKLIKTPFIETNNAGSCLWLAEQILISNAILNLNQSGSDEGRIERIAVGVLQDQKFTLRFGNRERHFYPSRV